MKNMSLRGRIALYLAVAVALAALGYIGSHSLGRAALLGAIGLGLGVVMEFSGALESKGVLPELRHDGYGVQTPAWYENEHEEGSESGAEGGSDAAGAGDAASGAGDAASGADQD